MDKCFVTSSLTATQIYMYTIRVYIDDRMQRPHSNLSGNVTKVCQSDIIYSLLQESVHAVPLDGGCVCVYRDIYIH